MDSEPLTRLEPGTPILVGGDRVTYVSERLAADLRPGDALVALPDTGELLHLPAADRAAARHAVDRAELAFQAMGAVTEAQLDDFYRGFAARLEDDEIFAPIAAANEADVAAARERGRSVTRLVLNEGMRADMVAGLLVWTEVQRSRGRVVERVEHDGWRLEQVTDRLGVVAFVFEGRPNVFADACGVLRGGNTVVFRIGSDALGTARAIVEHALAPALREAGLPTGAASLVDAPSHAAGWALFGDPRLALAVARGSGPAVHQLSTVARLTGNAVSAHGTGGAWMIAGASADPRRFHAAVVSSLDRKVCNTLNTCCIVRERAAELVPVLLEALGSAGAARGTNPRLHVREQDRRFVPPAWFERSVPISRATGVVDELQATAVSDAELGVEWEWEDSPEVTLAVVEDVAEATALFNRYSPRFVISVISEDRTDHDLVWDSADAPYVGDGFTRWVDGQYALGTPELGLSNWERGRLFGRSGILSGDGIVTIRSRAVQSDPDLHR